MIQQTYSKFVRSQQHFIEEQKQHSTTLNDEKLTNLCPSPPPVFCRPKKAIIGYQDAKAEPSQQLDGAENIFPRASLAERRQSKQIDKILLGSAQLQQRYEGRCFSFAVPKFVDSAAAAPQTSVKVVGGAKDEVDESTSELLSLAS